MLWLLGVCALTAAVWVAALVAAPPQWTKRANVWGGVVLGALTVAGLVPLLGDRSVADVGVVTELGAGPVRLLQAMTVVVVCAGIGALLTSGRSLGRAGWVVSGLWGLAAVDVVGGLTTGTFDAAQPMVVLALATHAVVAAVPDADTFLVWSRRALRVIVGGSVACVVLAPEVAYIGANFAGELDRTLFGVARLSGITPHPGALGFVAAMAVVVEVGAPDRWSKWWACAAVGCLVFAQSRTLWSAAVVALIVLLMVRRPGARALATVACASVIVTLAARPSLVTEADWTQGSNNVATVSGRTVIWDYSLRAFEAHEWIGVGPGFMGERWRLDHLPPSLQFVVNAHNQAVQTLAQNGLVGLALLCILVVAGCVAAWSARHVDGGIGLALMTVVVLNGMTSVPLRPNGVMVLPPLIVFGYLAVATRKNPHFDPRVEVRDDTLLAS